VLRGIHEAATLRRRESVVNRQARNPGDKREDDKRSRSAVAMSTGTAR
jgi:hypothetical protein